MSDYRQKQLQDLQESRDNYRQMLDLSADIILTVRPKDGKIVDANPAACALTGFSQRELLGMQIWQLHPDGEQASARQYLQQAAAGKQEVLPALRFIIRQGGHVDIEMTANQIMVGGEKLLQYVCRNISARRNLERNQGNLQSQLMQSEKMASLGHLVAGVAHEINTPLGALHSNNDLFARIIMKLKAVLDSAPDGLDHAAISKIDELFQKAEKLNAINKTAAARIISIVKSLRKFARRDEMEITEINIAEALDSTLTLLNHEFKDRIEVVRDYGQMAPFRCYPNKLNQVFMNILVNAAQAVEGKGTISVRTRQSGSGIEIEITDTGKGIAAADLERIFEPGFTTKGAGVGTGLGLSIVKQIIEDHQGTIAAESVPGKGTTFCIALPFRE